MTDRPDLDAIESDLLMYETANTEWVDFIEGRRSEAHDPTAINAFMADTAPTALRSLLTYARALEANHAVIDTERANYRTEINLWKRTVQEQNAKIAALEQERDEARRDAETAAAAENANAADLKAARDLLAEQQRAFVVAVEAMEARHDAEIAGIVEEVRSRPLPVDPECDIVRVTGDETDGWGVTCCERHDLVGEHDSAASVRCALDAILPGLEWWEEEPGVWMANHSIFDDLADSIATTHAAALARHAGRNTTAEVPRD